MLPMLFTKTLKLNIQDTALFYTPYMVTGRGVNAAYTDPVLNII